MALRRVVEAAPSLRPRRCGAALADDAQRIEADRGVAIEVVGVGDAPLTDATEALVAAAREAMVNAAKHSGCERVDVYAEVDDGVIEVFVRDRGVPASNSTASTPTGSG